MATSIHVSRKTKAASLAALQADTEVHQVTADLADLLASKPLPLITGADVLAALRVPYPSATTFQDPPEYWWIWEDPPGEWTRHCVSTSVISIPGTSGKEPIQVSVEEHAQYADAGGPFPTD